MKDLFRKKKQQKSHQERPDSVQKALKHFRLRYLWVWPLMTMLIYLLSSMFMDAPVPRIIISVAVSFFPWKELMDKIFYSSYQHLRTQILVMLQTITTSVSSGWSIEQSLKLVRPVIERTFGKRCVLIKPLIALENDLEVHMSLTSALDSFSESINFPEIIPVFHAIGMSGRIGNNTLAILRSSCQMLSEMNAVQNEINAINAGKNTEAAILCLMPFAITFSLNRMSEDYMNRAKETATGSILLAVAFALGIISASLLFKYMTHKDGKGYKDDEDALRKTGKLPLSNIVRDILPAGFLSSRFELFSMLTLNPQNMYEEYLKKQVTTITVITVLGAVILNAASKNPLLSLIAVPAVYFLNVYDVKQKADLRKEELMKDIPLFMCLTSTLLEAGMQLPRSIEICSEAFPEHRTISGEMKNIKALMYSGVSPSDAIERFSLRIQIPEAQAALLLVARYGRLGTAEVLNLLSLQASSCWNLCRNAARKKQERESIGLLIPMTLDFCCVLLVAITPAIISMSI